MTTARNLFFLFAFTLFSIASAVLAIFNFNPFNGNLTAFLNFYLSFLVALTGLISLVILYFQHKKHRNENINRFFWSSIRQALLTAAALTLLLALRGSRTLDWLIALSIIIVTFLLELFFKTKKTVK